MRGVGPMGGVGNRVSTGGRSQNFMDKCGHLAWKVWKLKCEKNLICVFLILVSLKAIAINGNFRSKVMTLKIYFLPVYTIH